MQNGAEREMHPAAPQLPFLADQSVLLAVIRSIGFSQSGTCFCPSDSCLAEPELSAISTASLFVLYGCESSGLHCLSVAFRKSAEE